jgi:hypothetical protein
MTSINDISDLARILRERPEWADTIRSILLGQELLELPERFAKFVELTGENFRLVHQRLERLETDMAGVKTDLAEIKTRMNRMDGRMDNGFGTNYAIKVERNIRSIAGQYLNLRRIKVLRGIYSPGDLELEARIEQAEEDGNITPEEIDGLWRSDLILAARDRTTGSDTYIVIETSITVGDSDIARAKARAGTLSSILGQPATPVVIGAIVDADRTASASLEGVAVAIEPESWNA